MDPTQGLPPELAEAMQRRGMAGGQPGAAPAPVPGQVPTPVPMEGDPSQAVSLGMPSGSVEAQIIVGVLGDRLKSISKQEEMQLEPPEPPQPEPAQPQLGGF